MSTSQTSLSESSVSGDHINSIAELVKDKWEVLASKFSDLDPDDLQYFKEKETPILQATNMLTVWKVGLCAFTFIICHTASLLHNL